MDACVISAIFIVGCEVCNLEYDACTVQLLKANYIAWTNFCSLGCLIAIVCWIALGLMYSICNIIYIPQVLLCMQSVWLSIGEGIRTMIYISAVIFCKEKTMYISPVKFCVQPVLCCEESTCNVMNTPKLTFCMRLMLWSIGFVCAIWCISLNCVRLILW